MTDGGAALAGRQLQLASVWISSWCPVAVVPVIGQEDKPLDIAVQIRKYVSDILRFCAQGKRERRDMVVARKNDLIVEGNAELIAMVKDSCMVQDAFVK